MKQTQPVPLNHILVQLLAVRLLIPSIVLALSLVMLSVYLHSVSIGREQKLITQSVAHRVDDYIETAKQALQVTGLSAQDDPVPGHVETLLKSARQAYPFFSAIYFLDSTGVIQSISPANPKNLKLDMSNQQYYIDRGPANTFNLSRPFPSPENGDLTIYLSYHTPADYLIVGELSLARLQYQVATLVPSRPSELVFITDRFGMLLAHPQAEWVAQQATIEIINYPLPDTTLDVTKLAKYNRQLGFETRTELQITPWYVTAFIPLSAAFGPYVLTTVIAFFAFLIIWIFLVAAIRNDFIHKIAMPLTYLSKNVQTLTRSNFLSGETLPNAPLTYTEISDLSSNFTQMARTIQARQAALTESEQKYRLLIEQLSDAIFLEVDGRLEVINQKFSEIFGITPDMIVDTNSTWISLVAPASRDFVIEQGVNLRRNNVFSLQYECMAIDKHGKEFNAEVSASLINYRGGLAVQSILRDITQRKKAEQAEHDQRMLAEALRDSASALNSTLNFNEVMERILSNVSKVVPNESSNIMLIAEDGETVNVVASSGFGERGLGDLLNSISFNLYKTPNMRQMFESGKPMAIPDTYLDPGWLAVEQMAWIRSYAGAPIRSKNNTIGFINLDSHIPGFYTHELAERLQAFADQAGIALHNARLMSDLQVSNADLRATYENTLQGLSKALELRDYETEGHTLRVLQITTRLAERLGIHEPDLTHMRYGVLLHDIGKIGIPDSILFKPGPLTDEEWEIMRRHPSYSYQIMAPIPYLSKAAEIPYCHHEHWDGTGYPRGLKGEEIPLSARIFTVIDVWDALRYTRPYRTGWNTRQVLDYIKELAGTQFDPQIIEAFLELAAEEPDLFE